jgi:hypothetical protein
MWTQEWSHRYRHKYTRGHFLSITLTQSKQCTLINHTREFSLHVGNPRQSTSKTWMTKRVASEWSNQTILLKSTLSKQCPPTFVVLNAFHRHKDLCYKWKNCYLTIWKYQGMHFSIFLSYISKRKSDIHWLVRGYLELVVPRWRMVESYRQLPFVYS